MGSQKINAAKQAMMAKRDLDITHCTKQTSTAIVIRRRNRSGIAGMNTL
jgi:hypothetical protein